MLTNTLNNVNKLELIVKCKKSESTVSAVKTSSPTRLTLTFTFTSC